MMRQKRRVVVPAWSAILVVLAGLSTLASGGAFAQQPVEVASAAVTAVRVEGEELTLGVQLLDRAGNPASTPGSGSITAAVEGQPATVTSVTEGVNAALPLALVLVIDTSGSMAGAPLAAAKQAIRPLVESLQPGDRAAIVDFSQSVSVPVPLTGDKAVLLAGLNALAAGGNTSLYAAVVEATKVVQAAPEPRKAIVLLSDGEDFGNVSGVTQAQAVAAAEGSGVPHFVVGLGNALNTAFLETISRSGGGRFLSSASSAELGSLYASVSERLRRQFTVQLRLPGGLASGTRRGVLAVGANSTTFEFPYTAAEVAPAASLDGPAGALSAPGVFRLVNGPPGGAITFTLDGSRVEPVAGEPAVSVDPFQLNPAVEHVLVAQWAAGTGSQRVERRFTVAAIAPRVVAKGGEEPRPGERFEVEVASQPGALAVRFVVDGREVTADNEAPYEFQVPPGDELGHGDHVVSVVVGGGAGATMEFPFTIEEEGQSPVAGWVIVGLSGLAVVVAAGYGVRLGVARIRSREMAMDSGEFTARVAERLPATETQPRAAVAAPAPAVPGRGSWGVLEIVDGPGKGSRFELRDERELVGRGKFCSVRLPDKAVAEAHFVVSAEGDVVASLPHLRVEVDGEAIRTARLAGGETVKLGRTTMRFTLRGE